MTTISTHRSVALLQAVAQGLATWARGRQQAYALMSKTPDQREDLGLTLRDMSRLGA
jgi:uncharacterized protein YjiS (DUF1127 family)